MYTVARFSCQREDIKLAIEIGEMMNLIESGIYRGIRRKADGFACDVSESLEWSSQKDAMTSFMRRFERPIGQAIQKGISVSFDVAVGAEDRVERILTSLWIDVEFMTSLVKNGVDLEVSIYPGPEDRPADSEANRGDTH